MPTVGITFDTDQEEAEQRVSVDGNGEVTDDGNYYRERDFSMTLYETIMDIADEDPNATVTKVKI